jgi:diaminopimelate epimerase
VVIHWLVVLELVLLLFVLHHNNLVGPKIRIKTEQSLLETDIQDKMVYLKGPAEIVYQSVIQL